MTISYQLQEEDYLNYQLFVASRSERIVKKRKRNRLLVPVLYVLLGVAFASQASWALAGTFVILGVLWFFLYPLWERNMYVKHYRNFIQEHYKQSRDKTLKLELNREYFWTSDGENESKIQCKEILDMWETGNQIFIRIQGGQAFILPKKSIPELETLIVFLKDLALKLEVKYEVDLNWKWS